MRRAALRPSGSAVPVVHSPPLPSSTHHPDASTLYMEAGPAQSLGLHRAASTGDISLVLFALENGQPVNHLLNGIAPLHVAACMGNMAITQVLMSYGADINISKAKAKVTGPGVEGSTPLHFAAANGHVDIVRMLLEHGATPQPLDRDMQTPESLAMLSQNYACASVLRQWVNLHGKEGYVDLSSTTRDPFSWNDQSLLELTRERSHSRSPHNVTDTSEAAGFRRDAPVSSTLSSPAYGESKRRTSFPALFEKASNPAATIRNALFSSSPSTPRLDDQQSLSLSLSSSALRIPRISSRASFTNLFSRRNTAAQSASDDAAHCEAESGRTSSATLSRPESIQITRNRSHSKSSTNASTPPPSMPILSALSSPPRKLRHPTDASPAVTEQTMHLSSHSHISRALASTHLRRLRSNSASSNLQDAEQIAYTRARAHSEAAASSQHDGGPTLPWCDGPSTSLRDDVGLSDSSL